MESPAAGDGRKPEIAVDLRGGPANGADARRVAVWLLATIATILIIAALRETAWVTGTVALAFFAALALWPVDAWIRTRAPRGLQWLGHAAALLIMLLVFALFSLGLMFIARQVVSGVSRYQEQLQGLADRLDRWSAIAQQQSGEGTPIVERLVEPVVSLATRLVQSVWSTGGILTLLFFLVWLMLLETPSFTKKLSAIASRHDGRMLRHVIDTTASRFRRYLAVRTLMGLATAALYVSWLWWWNLDFLLVWGLLAFLLNYIPTVGSIIAGVLPVGLAFLQRDPASAMLIAGGLIVIEQVMGNYVDPKLQGRQLSLSPFVVLVALMVWTWIWGLIGALLAVPMTLIITTAFAHIEPLRPIALALSNAENMEELEAITNV